MLVAFFFFVLSIPSDDVWKLYFFIFGKGSLKTKGPVKTWKLQVWFVSRNNGTATTSSSGTMSPISADSRFWQPCSAATLFFVLFCFVWFSFFRLAVSGNDTLSNQRPVRDTIAEIGNDSFFFFGCVPIFLQGHKLPLTNGKAVMCAYKLCRVEFKYWGMQAKIERFIHDIGNEKKNSPKKKTQPKPLAPWLPTAHKDYIRRSKK